MGILLLGDSHVRRLDEKKLLDKSIKAVGIGGLESAQVNSRHRGTINSKLIDTNKVITHIGSNDDAKGVPPEKVVNILESAGNRVVQVNSKVKVAILAIFLQVSELAQNKLTISKTNLVFSEFCYHPIWGFLDHGNFNFNHLDQGGIHLTDEGIHLFAKNITGHVFLPMPTLMRWLCSYKSGNSHSCPV